MHRSKKILAVISARGQSKRLPRKNIKLLSGRPLIAWTINQARASRYLDKVIVSTDDKEIAEVSREYKAEIPFLRPAVLATDEAKSMDTVLHAVKWFRSHNIYYDLVMLLQPTSPLRETGDIDRAIELLLENDAPALVSVFNGKVNGAIYLAYCDYLMKERNFSGPETFSYSMPEERSLDIDEDKDFMLAERIKK